MCLFTHSFNYSLIYVTQISFIFPSCTKSIKGPLALMRLETLTSCLSLRAAWRGWPLGLMDIALKAIKEAPALYHLIQAFWIVKSTKIKISN